MVSATVEPTTSRAGDEDGCMDKVSAEDVARAAGVSRAAVSQIVNGRGERFAADTRTRVTAAAKELGYQPSAAGRSLRRGISDIVVAVVPNITFGANLQDILDQLTVDVAEHGLFLVVRYSPAADPSFDRFITALRPAAVLPLAPLSEAHRRILASRGTLVVDRATRRPPDTTWSGSCRPSTCSPGGTATSPTRTWPTGGRTTTAPLGSRECRPSARRTPSRPRES